MTDEDGMAVICRSVSIGYGGTTVVPGLDLAIRRGEVVALLGPSGSGKSTLIAALAGFLPIRSGEIRINGRTVATAGHAEPPERRDVAVVFQSYALWPHLSAIETVAYPFRRRGLQAGESRVRAREILEQLGIAGLADRRPAELSGGEQQRVGLGRALARGAGLYLFDEPTSHLDADLRERLQVEIAEQRRQSGATAIYATHDTSEALAMADRVLLIRAGRIIQDGTPAVVYEQPASVWAARLTGPAETIPVRVHDLRDGRAELDVAGIRQTPLAASAGPVVGGEMRVVVRPDWVRIGGPVPARVAAVAFRGSHTDYRVDIGVGTVGIRLAGPPQTHAGASVGLTLERVWIPPDLNGGAATDPKS